MKQHKWHKEIKAWADGAEIEFKGLNGEWYYKSYPHWNSDDEYRIKPQPKEPQCKTHPNAPHGFCRDASHSEDRYVCECEFWEEPKEPQSIPSYKGDPTPTGIRKPKYMYVYLDDNYELSTIPLDNPEWKYIGKIKLEVEDD